MGYDFKPFNIHRFSNTSTLSKFYNFRGFTARISPYGGEREVRVQMSFCSHRDMFCKKTGAKMAQDPSAVSSMDFICNARDVLKEIKDVAKFKGVYNHGIDSDTWLFKYML